MIIKQRKTLCDLPVKDLKLDKSVQLRCLLNRFAIVDYAEAMERGEKFPPVVVFWVPGQTPKYVADGFHRVLAAKKAGKKTLRCLLRTGTRRDAILYAAGANRAHGVRRSAEDKRKTVLMFLGDKEWSKWTDTTLARHAGVSTSMVAKYRGYLGEEAGGEKSGVNGERFTRRYTDRNGDVKHHSLPAVKEDKTLDDMVDGSLCPYCRQKLPKGVGRGQPAGMKKTKEREKRNAEMVGLN